MTLYQTNFTPWDWGLVAVYVVGSIGIGLWANKYVGDLSDFLVAGRTLRLRLAAATMTGTELGLVTVMYMGELGYRHQYAALYQGVIEAAVLAIVGLTGFLVYRLRNFAVMTIPEFYEFRYSAGVRVAGACVMVISGVLNMGLFLKAGSQFLTAISGLEDVIYLKGIMSALLGLVLLYTMLGGMVSVVMTDLIQFFVLGLGMLIITGFVIAGLGFDGLAAVVTQHSGCFDPTDSMNRSRMGPGIGPLELLRFSLVVASAVVLWPPAASRILSVKSADVAKKLYLLSALPFLARRVLPVLWGIAAFAFVAGRPELRRMVTEAMDSGRISAWSVMPLYLAKALPTGFLGLVTAGMVAAFMSTHDSYLLCWSSVITQDIVAPLVGDLSQAARIRITRTAILAIGAALLFWGLWYEISSSLWNYMAVTGSVYLAGAVPIVAGGLYWSRSSSIGAYCGLAGGLMGLLAMDPVLASLHEAFGWSVQGAAITVTTFPVAALAFVGGSLLFPDSGQRERA